MWSYWTIWSQPNICLKCCQKDKITKSSLKKVKSRRLLRVRLQQSLSSFTKKLWKEAGNLPLFQQLTSFITQGRSQWKFDTRMIYIEFYICFTFRSCIRKVYPIKNHYSSLCFLLWDLFSDSSPLIQEGKVLAINLSMPPNGLPFNLCCLKSVIFWSFYWRAFYIFYNLISRTAYLFLVFGFLSLGLGTGFYARL